MLVPEPEKCEADRYLNRFYASIPFNHQAWTRTKALSPSGSYA
jgi:hypothetical protein